MRLTLALGAAILVLAACGDGASDESMVQPEGDGAADRAATGDASSDAPFDSMACGRGQDGQTDCLVTAFSVEQCGDATVLEAMRRTQDGARTHYTAYSVEEDCLIALERSARAQGFVQQDGQENLLIASADDGARSDRGARGGREDRIDITRSADGGGFVVWERIKQ